MWDEPLVWERRPTCTLITETIKGVGSYRQQDGGHGSWNPLRSV